MCYRLRSFSSDNTQKYHNTAPWPADSQSPAARATIVKCKTMPASFAITLLSLLSFRRSRVPCPVPPFFIAVAVYEEPGPFGSFGTEWFVSSWGLRSMLLRDESRICTPLVLATEWINGVRRTVVPKRWTRLIRTNLLRSTIQPQLNMDQRQLFTI